MRRVPEELLRRMAGRLGAEDRDEMAIPSYLHGNPAMRWMAWRRIEVVAARIRARLAGRRDAKVLDFGCGTGVLLEEASRFSRDVYGVDLQLDAARLLVEAWKLDKVTLVPAADAAAQVPGGLDLIVAAEVLEHVEPLGPTLALFREKLAKDGTLLVSLPTESGLYRLGRKLAGFHGHYHHANAASIHAELERAGFRTLRKETVPLPGPAAIYWVTEYGA